ncbi:DUF4173 domain-containing protein [bacterium]|nr:DUF4173 domain-containing protein [bacterium]
MNRKEVSDVKEASESVVIQPETQKADKDHNRLVWITLIVGLVVNYLFYRKPIGISYPIFVLVFYGVFLRLLQKRISYKWDFGWFLTLPILLLSCTYFFFSNRLLMGLNFFMIPVLMVAQTILLTSENDFLWFDIRFLGDIFKAFFIKSFRYIGLFFTTLFKTNNVTSSKKGLSTGKKVLIGLAIALPILVVVLLLLVSADAAFSQYMDKVFRWIERLNIAGLIRQLFVIVISAMFLFSYLWSYLQSKKASDSVAPKLSSNLQLDSVISITVLSLLNLVYIAFVVFQFSYIFGGSLQKTLPPNYSYAEYARSGFFEMLVVTLINFTLLGMGFIFKPHGGPAVKSLLKVLQTLLVICTIVMLVSAFMRMSLYEAEYGFTYLRILTQAFMIFLLVLFVIALMKIWNAGIGFLQSFIVVSLVAYLIINYMNIDVIVTKKNLDRFTQTGQLDVDYLTELSYDSVPLVLHYFLMKDLPRGFNSLQMHQKLLISRFLTKKETSFRERNYNFNYLTSKEISEIIGSDRWQSFNLSKYRARNAILKKLNLTYEEYLKYLELK